ncbi:MAG: hypothetical protein IIZ89_02380 [Muribaculaceae bacterium]|nr:hypothetical protein [Muribaculaceae bacterium]
MKKKLTLIVALLTLMFTVSCVTKDAFVQVIGCMDYQKIGHGKVFISEANSVSFEYTPIASITVIELSGHVSKTKKAKANKPNINEGVGDDIYYASKKDKTDYREASYESALKRAVAACEDKGGDGIINLKYHREYDKERGERFIVTGMIIKRK